MQLDEKPQRLQLTAEVIARFAARSIKPSARLEGRVIPADYQQPAQVAAILAKRHAHA